MYSNEVVIFLAFIASVNCYLSDDIYKFASSNEQCNQSKSVLDSLNIVVFCKIPGDRGPLDLLCNGIKSVIRDICNVSSTITLDQVKNSSKFDDTVQNFCKKVGSLGMLVKLPKYVSDTLNYMKNASCSPVCTSIQDNLNPLCSFLVSYIELKNSKNVTVPKKVDVSNTNSTKNSVPNVQNANNQTKTEQVSNPALPVSNEEANPEEQPNETNSKTSDQNPSKDVKEPLNKIQEVDNDVTDQKLVIDPGQSLPSLKETEKIDDNAEPEMRDKNVEQEANDDKKLEPDQVVNEPDSFSNKAAESGPVNIDVNREPFDEAENSNFFTYFVFISALCIFFYLAMYNKKKILALLIEGRRSNVKRRPNSAAYSKLDCTLEEAMASGPSTSSSNTLLY